MSETTVDQRASDAAEHRRLETVLEAREAELAAAYENAPLIMLSVDSERRIRKVNAAAVAFTGRCAADMIGQRAGEALRCLNSLDDPAGCGFGPCCGECNIRNSIRDTIETGRAHRHVEATLPIRVDGGIRRLTFLVSTTRVSDANDFLVLVSFLDITERKQAEEQLREARLQAETANRVKSEFLANIGHEIRTPMTAILGFADLLLDRDFPREQQREFLETIEKNGKSLLELIDDILDLLSLETGRFTIEFADCSLQTVLDDVLVTARAKTEAKRLALEVELPSPLPSFFRTDPARLRQILVNLIDNAIKFTERGEVRVVLRRRQESDGAASFQFVVSDTGIGIDPEKLETIFQPFMQADMSAKRRYGGTGLGLAISRRLARLLGGDIDVSTEPGRGSTFTLTLPEQPKPISV